MTENRHPVALLALAVVVLLASPACRNPLEIGLGDNVDIDRPVVSFVAPDLGSFLRGSVTLSGQASDDTQVVSVQLAFKFAGDSHLGGLAGRGPVRRRAGALGVRRWTPAPGPTAGWRSWCGSSTIPASGPTTQELLFTIDNEAPNIILTFPAINPDTYDPDNPPTVGKNGAIFGTVVDRDAIAFEYPKIRFWRMVDPEPAIWTTLRPGDVSSPSVYDFRYSVPANQVGDFYLRLIAQDMGGEEYVLPPLGEDPYRVVIVSGTPAGRLQRPPAGGRRPGDPGDSGLDEPRNRAAAGPRAEVLRAQQPRRAAHGDRRKHHRDAQRRRLRLELRPGLQLPARRHHHRPGLRAGSGNRPASTAWCSTWTTSCPRSPCPRRATWTRCTARSSSAAPPPTTAAWRKWPSRWAATTTWSWRAPTTGSTPSTPTSTGTAPTPRSGTPRPTCPSRGPRSGACRCCCGPRTWPATRRRSPTASTSTRTWTSRR